jgi:hypothetical protein
MLGKVNRLIGMAVRRNAKYDAERVLVARQLLQRHADLISSVKFEIESQTRLASSNSTRQILPLLTALEHRQIRIENVGALMRSGTVNQNLSRKRRSAYQTTGQQPLASELNEQTGSLHTLFTHSYDVLTRPDCYPLYIQTTPLQGKNSVTTKTPAKK